MSIDGARYMSLETFRRNGDGVATPVWFAEANGDLYVFSAPDAGKVKRLRNGSRARVAACDFRGTLLGEWRDAHAYLVDDAQEVRQAHRLLLRKYGWQMRWLDLVSRLGGRLEKRQFIRVVPAR